MKIKELKELLKDESKKYVDVEYYTLNNKNVNKVIHTDTIQAIKEVNDDMKVLDYQLMTEDDYNNTILANTCERADFGVWYDDENAKVLVVIVEEAKE